MSEEPALHTGRGAEPVGIGGWLVLPLLGLALTLIRAPFNFAAFANLGPALAVGSGIQNVFLVCEAAGNLILLIVFPAYLLYLAYQKSRRFPRVYIVFAIAAAVFTIVDLIGGYALFGHIYEAAEIPFMDQDTWMEVLRTAILVCVWMPYMQNSRRVANTFVEP